MMRTKTPPVLLALSYLALAGGLILTYHKLPDPVASHFNTAGEANAWMPRAKYLWFMAVSALSVSALVLGLFHCIRYFPPTSIKLPRGDYWLAPARRHATFDFLWHAGIWLACLDALFLLGLHLMVVSANATAPPRLSSGVWLLGGAFLAGIGIWSFLFVRHFKHDET